MRKIGFFLIVFAALQVPCAAQTLDRYGGLTGVKCNKTTGYYHIEKIGNQWWLCTPLGNVFFMLGVYVVNPPNPTAATHKYGSIENWAREANQRLKSWGFNTLDVYADVRALPTAGSQPFKLPFVGVVRPAYYSMTNPLISTTEWRERKLLAEPLKNIIFGSSPYYRGWRPSGIADYFDAKLDEWLSQYLKLDRSWDLIKHSPYLSYLIGITSDDGDQMYGFGAGDAFPTNPPGHNNEHLGWIIATMSPVQTANPQLRVVYADTRVYTKKAWHDMLSAKYKTISALNAAWGANYTTLDSSGMPIIGETVGTGDGRTQSFTHTLAHLVPSRFSVEVVLGGAAVAGDTGNGNLFGPTLSGGKIDYATGELVLNFAPGHAPAPGAVITVNYVQNGWGIGTGLLDEDGRPPHQAWLSSDSTYLRKVSPSVKADFDDFLYQVAAHYFNSCRTSIKAVFPNIMYMGPDSVTTWSAPSRAPVLRAAGQYLDLMITSGMTHFTQGMIDYVAQYYGDKPYVGGEYRTANADSALFAFSDRHVGGFATQAARGQAYYDTVTTLQAMAVTATGSHPYVGTAWWQYTDNWGEKLNWGLVTLLDNAYDGHEAVTGPVPCSQPLRNYACGGEKRNYGDVLTLVKKANYAWIESAGKMKAQH